MRAILICPEESPRTKFETAAAEFERLSIFKTLTDYPEVDFLRRLVRSSSPDVIFLSHESPEAAEKLNSSLAKDFPRVPRIGLHTSQEPAIFRQAMRMGVRELLSAPFERAQLGEALSQIARHLESHPADVGCTDHFFAFMPAKAGVGASTVAANFTWALSEMPGVSPLLADFDQHSGMVGFLFNATNDFTLADPAARMKQLDDEAWSRLVTRAGNVELLLSGAPHSGDCIPSSQVSDIVEFARRTYSVVNADLPDTLDETTLAVLHDARRIFLVTTCELPALRLAKLKTLMLRKLDLESKVSLIVNRVTPRMNLSISEIEETVGLPAYATFPSDYNDVSKSLQTGKPAPKLAASARAFANKVLNQKVEAKKRHRFIERFAVVPMKYGFE